MHQLPESNSGHGFELRGGRHSGSILEDEREFEFRTEFVLFLRNLSFDRRDLERRLLDASVLGLDIWLQGPHTNNDEIAQYKREET